MEEFKEGSRAMGDLTTASDQASPLSEGFAMGDWWIRPQEGIVERGRERRSLSFQKMEILVYLATRQGQVVPKHEIYEAVWSDAIVEETALPRCISEIRRALDDDASNPRYIRTVPKRGYRLIPAVTVPSTVPRAAEEGPAPSSTGSGSTSTAPRAVAASAQRRADYTWTLALVIGMGVGALFGGYFSRRFRTRSDTRRDQSIRPPLFTIKRLPLRTNT